MPPMPSQRWLAWLRSITGRAAGVALPNAGTVRMHVKAAVADDHTALVGSANLTGQALTHNMELGLLVEGGEVPRQLDAHFRSLIASKVLVSVGG